MKEKVTLATSHEVNGTSYAGRIRCDFETLKEEFGNPDLVPTIDSKVTCEWDLALIAPAARIVFTVYNWKDQTPPEENKTWHIGSRHFNDSVIFNFLEKALRCEILSR